MPRILERFTADTVQQEIGGRRAQASDFGAEMGAGLQEMGQTTQRIGRDYVERQEEDDARAAMVDEAKLRAEFGKRADDALTSGEDLDKIREEFENKQAENRGRRTTKRGLDISEQHGAVSANTFREQLRQVESRRYGASLVKDGKEHSASMSAILQRSPELLPFAIESNNKLFDTYKGRVPPDVLEQARQQQEDILWRAGANAGIERDPKQALELLQSGGWEGLRPDDRTALINKAQVDIRAADITKKQLEQEAKKKQDDLDNQHMKLMLRDFGDGKLWTANSIAKMDDLSVPAQKQMIAWVQHQADRATRKDKPDHSAYEAGYNRMFLEETDPGFIADETALNKYIFETKMPVQDARALRADFERREKPGRKALAGMMNEYRRLITAPHPVTGMAAPQGLQAFREFRAYVGSMADEAVAAGKPLHQAFNREELDKVADMYRETALAATAEEADRIREAEKYARQAEEIRKSDPDAVIPSYGQYEKDESARIVAERAAQAAERAAQAAETARHASYLAGRGPKVYSRRTDLPGAPWVYWIDNEADWNALPPGTIGRIRKTGEDKVKN